MNKQINLQEAIQIAELLKNCNIVVNVDGGRVAVTEQQVLDYAIELAVKNNTELLEQVKNIEQNLYSTGLRIEIATREMVMTDSQINKLYKELRVFADMLDSKSRYVKLDEIGLSDVLTNILTKAKYSMVYNLVQDKNGLTEAKLEKILSQYPEISTEMKNEFTTKMASFGFKWINVEVAGKSHKKLAYTRSKDAIIKIDIVEYMKKSLNEVKEESKDVEEPATEAGNGRIIETLIIANKTKQEMMEQKEEIAPSYELSVEDVLKELRKDMETIYSLPKEFIIDNKEQLKDMIWKGILNSNTSKQRKNDLRAIMEYINEVCGKQYAK